MAKVHLKPLHEQVVVITGASSGIGLVTARMAARKGARLVLAARNTQALEELCDELQANGAEAIWVEADVGEEQQVRQVARRALERFGGFDTWVNNAGVSVYGKIMDVSIDDMRRVFETNFWGVVFGSKAAAQHLRGRGGALINVGSVLSDAAVPLQGIYTASKHAVKGFTDSLRMELEAEGAPVSVTLIKPAAIDTPYTKHAKNYLDSEPTHTPPVYAPELVAEAILHAAEHPVRDLFVGGAAKMMSTMNRYAPRLADKYMESVQFTGQQSEKPIRRDRSGALHEPSFGLEERGDYEGRVFESSAITKASMHPVMATTIAVGAGLAVAALWRAQNARSTREINTP